MSCPTGVGFRAFAAGDVDACMALFDANCPAYFGAETVLETPDGWGPGMHRIDTELTVRAEAGP